MTVGELKAKLQNVPDNFLVVISTHIDGELVAYGAEFETVWEPSEAFELGTGKFLMG